MSNVPRAFDFPGCVQEIAAIEAELGQLTADLSEAQFHAPTRDGGWSIGHCIEHLVLTGQAFLPKWDSALAEVARNGRHEAGPFPYPWWTRQILKFAGPPYRIKTKTADSFVPRSRRPMGETTRRFLNMHEEFKQCVANTRDMDAKRSKVQSPFVPWIWYPLGFSFDLALAHERRHLWQAWQVRRQLIDSR